MRLPVGAPRSGGPPGSRIQQAPSVDFGAIRADRVAASPRPAPASARSPHVAHGGGPRSLAHGPLRYRLGGTRRKPRDVGVPSGHMGRADPGGRIPAGSPAACWALETVADSAHALGRRPYMAPLRMVASCGSSSTKVSTRTSGVSAPLTGSLLTLRVRRGAKISTHASLVRMDSPSTWLRCFRILISISTTWRDILRPISVQRFSTQTPQANIGAVVEPPRLFTRRLTARRTSSSPTTCGSIWLPARSTFRGATCHPKVKVSRDRTGTNIPAWALRALLVGLDRWVREGVEPPASAHPRLADHTLVPESNIKFPAIPGVHSPLNIHAGYRADLEGSPSASTSVARHAG
jgi:hypothetical protein